MPLGWYRSFLSAGPAVPPESISQPPVILLHPGDEVAAELSAIRGHD